MVVAGAIPSTWWTASIAWLNESWSDEVDPDPDGAVEIGAVGSGGEGRVAVSGAGIVRSISETGMRGGGNGVGRVGGCAKWSGWVDCKTDVHDPCHTRIEKKQ